MLKKEERKAIIDLINREVVPAIGCTEPVAVALCVAKASETLGKEPESISLHLSANILKNAMGVGIPGTGMIGLPIAVALGALVGRSEYGLEVLRDVTSEDVQRGKRFIDEGRIKIALKDGIEEKLYIEVLAAAGEDESEAIIAGGHTNFVLIRRNGDVLMDKRSRGVSAASDSGHQEELSLSKVWEFATESPVEELSFILKARDLNKAAAESSFKGDFGHRIGKMLSYTSAACDARMAGAMIPVMSNSGSGNQGIAATLPVVVFAEEHNSDEEQLIRALTLSHLTAIYIKQSLGRLSALCGCVVAATGSSCGITYLMGGGYKEVTYAVKNMIANLTGMICDGAKPSCAMKLTSGVSTAVLSAMMAMEHECVSCVEGIIDDDVDLSIRNLTRIGRDGMNETDRLVLDIMTGKN